MLTKNKLRRLFIKTLKKFFKVAAFFLVLFSIFGLIIFLLTSKSFKVKSISCEKEKGACNQKEFQFLNDFIGNNIFLLDDQKKAQKINEQLWWVKEIRIKRKLPDKLLIKVVERQPVFAATKDNRTWFLVDEENKIFRQTIEEPKGTVIIHFGKDFILEVGKKLEPEEEVFSKLLTAIDEEYLMVKRIKADLPQITLYLSDGVVATLSALKSMRLQVGSLHFILKLSRIEGKLPRFIDLRFSKPVIQY